MQYFQSFDGLSLAYLDEGPKEGLPLLCLSGLTRTVADFDYLAPHLPDVRLIRMDYRGRGASDHAPVATAYSLENEARDALDLLDHLGIERAAILGTSRGGMIAMLLAATSKARLMGVCLNDIGPEIAPEGLARIESYLGRAPVLASRAQVAAALPFVLPGFANVPPERWAEEAARQTRETPQGLALAYDAKLRDAFMEATKAAPPDLWPLFDTLDGLPLALIRGAGSDILAPKTAAEMRRRRPDMIFAEVPDRGHVPFLDEPAALEAIGKWRALLP